MLPSWRKRDEIPALLGSEEITDQFFDLNHVVASLPMFEPAKGASIDFLGSLLRNSSLSLANASSIGLKSGE